MRSVVDAAYNLSPPVIRMQKPKTVTKTEEIEKPVTHEREVTTQKAYTEDVEMEEERAVQTTKQVQVQLLSSFPFVGGTPERPVQC